MMFLGNHGVVVCGDRIDHAYDEFFEALRRTL